MSDTINITVNPDGDEVAVNFDDSAGAAVFAAAAEASAIAAATAASTAAASVQAAVASDAQAAAASATQASGYKDTAAAQAAIAAAQAELVIGRGLYLPEDNLSITYNADGTVNTVSNGTLTKRITYSNGIAVSVATI